MRKRWILMVGAVALVALTAAIAFAAGRGTQPNTAQQGMVQACDAMQDSPGHAADARADARSAAGPVRRDA